MKQAILTALCLFTLSGAHANSQEESSATVADVTEILTITSQLDSTITEYLNLINKDSIGNYVNDLCNFETRFLLAENRRDIAVWIAKKFEGFGFADVTIDSLQNTLEYPPHSKQMHTTWQYNVVASLEGTEHPDTICVLGAHYDSFIMGPNIDPYTFSPGANNNASGVAACLEIARIMAASGFKPKYTIDIVAFGSEEFMTMFADGPTGSQHYVAQTKESGKTFAFMLDNNQISYRPSPDQWQLDFQNCPGGEWLSKLAHQMADKYTRIVPVDTSDHIPYSDVYYFWSAGYPAIFFEEYHFCPHTFTAQDIPENCDMKFCAEVARISAAILLFYNY